MRLSEFLIVHAEEILQEWDSFAATVPHAGKPLSQQALRDHAGEILRVIALDLQRPQDAAQQEAKSKGQAERGPAKTPAETHADFRMVSGFDIESMITEYRALRASVLKIWAQRCTAGPDEVEEMTRFNEAIDQAIAESVSRYTRQTKKSTDLFIGVLGHDIRNPLGTIVMSAQILARSTQTPQKVVQTIINSAVRINGLIEQVVDFTRAQASGAMAIHRVPGDLQEQLLKIVHETQARNPTRVVELRRTGDFLGSWDEGRMGQLLSNLLGNAIRYGDPARAVTVEMWSEAAEVAFSVHNFGPAIREGDLSRIFEPLSRGTGVETAEARLEPAGLGLGLYICREIVRAHAGSLTVQSSDESGTTFTVRLPRFAVGEAMVIAP
ncbi:MAG: sensor histidine kinase [Burkholderiales bacterium]|nr:sensor histidine kinase [Burkholderiales bacterium]